MLLDHFPAGELPRSSQNLILQEIDDAIDHGIKFIIVQAPTGAGKSHISATLANFSRPPDSVYIDAVKSFEIFRSDHNDLYGRSSLLDELPSFGTAVLTLTKQLQEQYSQLFKFSRALKGKQNYICSINETFKCDVAPCTFAYKQLGRCMREGCCPFFVAREEALTSKFGVYNYSAYLCLPPHVRKRQFLVCDEASEFEDTLASHYSLTVEYSQLAKDGIHVDKLKKNDVDNIHAWMESLDVQIDALLDRVEKEMASEPSAQRMRKLIPLYRRYTTMAESLKKVTGNIDRMTPVLEPEDGGCTIVPLHVDIFAKEIYKCADTVVFLSSTIIDPIVFAKTCGIDGQCRFVDVPSEFDPHRSPVKCWREPKLNKSNIEKNLPSLIKLAQQICDKHSKENGIIHTHTLKIGKAIKDVVKENGRYIFRSGDVTNEVILMDHLNRADPTVLVSPSLGFGLDLEGDDGRFQVIIKTPFPYLGSNRIRRLCNMNRRWYEIRTLIKLIQMCGRTTRSVDDHSITYILDGTAWDLFSKYRDTLPEWFRARLA